VNLPLLAFDFDGVLCDSTEECIVSAWNAWLQIKGQEGFVMNPQEVPEPYQSEIRRLRSHVRTGGEYGVLLQALEDHRDIRTRAGYEESVNTYRSVIKPFSELFFTARDRMRNKDERHWLDLHTVYPGIPERLRELWSKFRIFVVTGKDRDAVKLFFKTFDLLLADDRIYDKDAGHDKLGAICKVAAQCNQPIQTLTFIDDNITHLIPVHEAGCRVFLAEWGYHTDEDLDIARSHGVPVLKLDTWFRMI